MELPVLNRISPPPQPGLKAEPGQVGTGVPGDFAQALDQAGAVAVKAKGSETSSGATQAPGGGAPIFPEASAEGIVKKGEAQLKKKTSSAEGVVDPVAAQAMLAKAPVDPKSFVSGAGPQGGAAEGQQRATSLSEKSSDAPKISSLSGTPGEKPAMTLKQEVNSGTIEAVTSNRPWKADWVFQAGDKRNPELRGLFDGAKAPAQKPVQPSGKQVLPAGIEALAQPIPLAELMAQAQAAQASKQRAGKAEDGSISPEAAVAGSIAASADTGGSVAQLMARMQSLSGEIDGIESSMGEQGVPAKGVKAKSAKPGLSAQTGISGGDFLELRSAKPASPDPKLATAADTALIGRIGGTTGNLSGKAGGKSGDGNLEQGAREFGGNAGELAAATGAGRMMSKAELGGGQAALSLKGQTTQDGKLQNRLTNESLRDLGDQIRTFSASPQALSAAGAGGEIRIRLNPDNLGELHLKVVTHGNQVGLQIQASDEKARKVIEDSLGSLKETLGAQNLTLAKFDITIAQSASQASNDSSFNSSNPNSNPDGRAGAGFDMSQGQGSGNHERGASSRDDSAGGPFGGASGRSRSIPGAHEAARAARAMSSGRLDMMA